MTAWFARMIRRTLGLLFAIAILPFPATDSSALSKHTSLSRSATEWQRYTVADEDFSVLMPVMPGMATSFVYADQNRGRRERIIAAYENGVVYGIDTYEKKSISLQDLISPLLTGSQPSSPVATVTVDGVTGQSFRFENEDLIRANQVFETSRHLYIFSAMGSKLGDPVNGIPKFFSSISFDKTRKGTQLIDGPGDQPALDSTTNQAAPTILSGRDVTRKVRVASKPEPHYTEEARKHGITGTVVLRAIFSSSGAVTNIHATATLPDGLTEMATEAARKIRFIPAIKDGRFVSMWLELQYNFNLY